MSNLHISLKLPIVMYPTVQVGILFCNEALDILLHPHCHNLMILLILDVRTAQRHIRQAKHVSSVQQMNVPHGFPALSLDYETTFAFSCIKGKSLCTLCSSFSLCVN